MTPFPSLEAALGKIVLQITAETLGRDVSPEAEARHAAVNKALREAWPVEMKAAFMRTKFVPDVDGGVRAMYDDPQST